MKLVTLLVLSTMAMSEMLTFSKGSEAFLNVKETSLDYQAPEYLVTPVETVIETGLPVKIKKRFGAQLRTDITSDVENVWTHKVDNFPYEDKIMDMFQTPDGGFLLVGTRYFDNIYNMDAWIEKIDKDGNHVAEYFIGMNNNDAFKKIIPMSNGNYLLVGDQYLDNTYQDVVTVYQVDSDANFIYDQNDIWVMRMGTSADNHYAASACRRPDGKWVLLSTVKKTLSGVSNAHVALFDLDTKLFSSNVEIGWSDSNETAYDISCREDNSVIVAAATNHNKADFSDGFLFEVNASLGVGRWTTQGYQDGKMTFNALLEHSTNGLLIGGVAYNGANGDDVFYGSYNFDDQNFTILNLSGWNNGFNDAFGALSEGKNGNVLLTSYRYSDQNMFDTGSIAIWNVNHENFRYISTPQVMIYNMTKAIQNRDDSIVYGLTQAGVAGLDIYVNKVAFPNKGLSPSLMLYMLN